MLSLVDWTQPWFRSVDAAASYLVERGDWRAALNVQCRATSLRNLAGLPIRFVAQDLLPKGTAYESFISLTGQVPSRDNLHDFFNALMWLSFPHTKQCLNAIHATSIETRGINNSRGAVRDKATLFDESAALLVLPANDHGEALANVLKHHQWETLFIEQRDAFLRHADVWVFGHALLEKLTTPFKAITAQTVIVFADEAYSTLSGNAQRDWLDLTLAERLLPIDGKPLSDTQFTPLPLSGVPGWWPGQDRIFYQDTKVFRRKRDADRRSASVALTQGHQGQS